MQSFASLRATISLRYLPYLLALLPLFLLVLALTLLLVLGPFLLDPLRLRF